MCGDESVETPLNLNDVIHFFFVCVVLCWFLRCRLHSLSLLFFVVVSFRLLLSASASCVARHVARYDRTTCGHVYGQVTQQTQRASPDGSPIHQPSRRIN